MKPPIILRNTSIVVPEYELGDCEKLELSLSVWDDISFKLIPTGYYWDEENKVLYLPRGLDVSYVAYLLDRKTVVDYVSDPAPPNRIGLRIEPKDDLQRKSLSYLIGVGEFAKYKGRSQLSLNLTTGSGKTYCAVASVAIKKKTPLIMTHNNNIKNQWRKSFETFTDVSSRDICDLKGSSYIDKIINDPKKKSQYKVYLVNRQTLVSYAKKNGWESLSKVMHELGIGVKVFDEAHLTFHANLMIDFFTNTEATYYLTATMDRSDHKESKIFGLVFKNVPIYGEESRKVQPKHINYVSAFFHSKPSYNTKATVYGRMGLDINKYATYLVDNDNFLTAIEELIDKLREIRTGRILVMTSSINSTFKMQAELKEMFPDLKIGVYNSEVPDEEKLYYLDNSDIIATTPKSLGTGTDIPGLKIVINTEPYASGVTADQVAGRLRYDGDKTKSLYVEMVDRAFPDALKRHKKRLKVFEKKCAAILELEL